MLDSVADQVANDDPQQGGVGFHGQIICNLEPDFGLVPADREAEIFQHRLDQLLDFQRCVGNPGASQLRHRHQALDQLVGLISGGGDSLDVAQCALAVVSLQRDLGQIGDAAHRDHRIAQIMCHPVVVGVELGVTRFQLIDQLLAFQLRLLARSHIALHGNPVGVPAGRVGDWCYIQLGPELSPALGVVEHLGARIFPAPQGLPQRAKPLPVGVRPLQNARGLADHLGSGIAGLALKGAVDVHDSRAGIIKGLGVGDDDGVIELVDAGLQQP